MQTACSFCFTKSYLCVIIKWKSSDYRKVITFFSEMDTSVELRVIHLFSLAQFLQQNLEQTLNNVFIKWDNTDSGIINVAEANQLVKCSDVIKNPVFNILLMAFGAVDDSSFNYRGNESCI